MRAIKTYYIVLDKFGVPWGIGKTKKAARANAFTRNKRHRNASLPFNPAQECSEKAYEAYKEYGCALALHEHQGVLITYPEKHRVDEMRHEDLIRQACAGELSNEDFKAKLKLDEKLDVMYAMLKEVKEDHEKIINHLKWDS